MPPPLRKPVLHGAQAEFIDELWLVFRAADRPTTRAIAAHIRDGDFRGMPSHETIRRTLGGHAVPTQWTTVEAIFLALCEMGHTDPHYQPPEGYSHDDRTLYLRLRDAWNDALDAPPSQPPSQRATRLWPEEPPF